MTTRIITGDCRTVLDGLPEQSVHCCVTSPPYFGLRDYGHDDQMGLEETPDQFVAGLVAVFRSVRRVLRDDGTLWLNIGDSYNAYNGNRGSSISLDRDRDAASGVRPKLPSGYGLTTKELKQKDLIGIPWMVAFALRADGWYLRQDIIWHKPNPMPESVQDRCTKAHEYVFLLSKGPRYYFDAEAIAERAIGTTDHDLTGPGYAAPGQPPHKGSRKRGTPPRHAQYESSDRAGLDEIGRGGWRNKRSVWTVATQPFKEAHFAVFPTALIEPMIRAGCPVGGTVLDPFLGSGTTGLVADRLQRHCIGVELNPEYAAMARRRIDGDAPLFVNPQLTPSSPGAI